MRPGVRDLLACRVTLVGRVASRLFAVVRGLSFPIRKVGDRGRECARRTSRAVGPGKR